MDNNYLIKFLNEKNTALVTKKRHNYLTYYGLEQQYTYVLKEGVIKTSIIQKDGREFNIAYVKAPEIISLLRDEVSNYTSSPFNVRVETETATFFKVPRVKFWQWVNGDTELQNYVKNYYRNSLYQAIRRQQLMTMNGKTGAVCAFLYDLVKNFGKSCGKNCYIIDFTVTNDDIAGFCGVSTRNSVNRILHQLKDEGVIELNNKKITVRDMAYLEQFVQD